MSEFKYEDKAASIDEVLKKLRGKWRLDAINWMDYDDVCQIIKAHIAKKWHLWDQSKPIEPWVNRVAMNQMRNMVRNLYSAYLQPCVNCVYNTGSNQCGITKSGFQDAGCVLMGRWLKNKKDGHNVKLPVTIEVHENEAKEMPDHWVDVEGPTERLNDFMKKELSPEYYKAYLMLFFSDKTEEEVALELGYISNEKNRPAGYKQIKNLKELFLKLAKDIIKNEDVFSITEKHNGTN
jgi:hypothetical protein